MHPLKISIDESKQLFLKAQMLDGKYFAPGAGELYKIIKRLGYVQIDTISIVERAHKHILWTRMPGYRNEFLDKLIDKNKKVFEFWDHAAAYMPVEHYRFTLPRKLAFAKKHSDWAKKNKKLLGFILERIKIEGALQSRDFEDTKKRGQWWDWKPAKDGLEYLFHTGKLAVKARKNFQKVYDLPERIIPGFTDIILPSHEELSEHLVLKTLLSCGIASLKEITYLRHHERTATLRTLKKLEEERGIIPLSINGIEKETYYTLPGNLSSLGKLKKFSLHDNEVYILSPFDNLVIQRKRLSILFGFDFVIEFYLPAEKRKFGYYLMPVLYGNEICGKIDVKADRKSGRLIVINEFWENGFVPSADFKEKYNLKLKELAEFSGCQNVIFQQKS